MFTYIKMSKKRSNIKVKIFEYDSDYQAWEEYGKIEKKSNKRISLKKTKIKKKKNNKKLMVKGIYKNYSYKDKDLKIENIQMGGDISFNFNINTNLKLNQKKEKKYDKFITKINFLYSDEKERYEAKKKLIFLTLQHHSPYNIAMMPSVGGLNIIKARKYKEYSGMNGFDRFDSFIAYINTYFISGKYKKEKNFSQEKLNKKFLNKIRDQKVEKKECIYLFCQILYKGDVLTKSEKEIVDRLTINGSKDFNSKEVLDEYFKLTLEWWKIMKTWRGLQQEYDIKKITNDDYIKVLDNWTNELRRRKIDCSNEREKKLLSQIKKELKEDDKLLNYLNKR